MWQESLKFVWQKEAGKTANNNEVFDHVTTVTKGSMYLLLPYDLTADSVC